MSPVYMTTFELTRKRHYPQQDIAPHGTCVIVPFAEFRPEWAVSLEEQGQRCMKFMLGNKPVVIVSLAVGVARSINVSEAPGTPVGTVSEKKVPVKDLWPKIEKGIVKAADVAKAKAEIPKPPEPTPAAKKPAGDFRAEYTAEEDAFLIELYNRTPTVSIAEIGNLFYQKFPKRTANSGTNRIHRLIISKAIARRNADAPNHRLAPSCTKADDLIIELWNKDLTYEEIRKAVNDKFPNEHISIEYRLEHLCRHGIIKRRNKFHADKKVKPLLRTPRQVEITGVTLTAQGAGLELHSLHDMEGNQPPSLETRVHNLELMLKDIVAQQVKLVGVVEDHAELIRRLQRRTSVN